METHMRQRNKKKNQGRIPFDQIDILEVLDDLGIDYRESGKNVGEGWIGVCCGFCGDVCPYPGVGFFNGAQGWYGNR